MIIKHHQNFIGNRDWRELAYLSFENGKQYLRSWNGAIYIEQEVSIETDSEKNFAFDPMKAYKLWEELSYKKWEVHVGKTKITEGEYNEIAKIEAQDKDYHSINNSIYGALKRVKDAIPSKAMSPVLTGVNIQAKDWTIQIIWTDWLTLKNTTIDDSNFPDCNIIIPITSLSLILKTFENFEGASVHINKNLYIKKDKTIIRTHLIDSSYPDCNHIINADLMLNTIINNKEIKSITEKAKILEINQLYFENWMVQWESTEWKINEKVSTDMKINVAPNILQNIITTDKESEVRYSSKLMQLKKNNSSITIALLN